LSSARPEDVFRAAAPGLARRPSVVIVVAPVPFPLDKFAGALRPFLSVMAKDVTVVSDKPSRLRDGTPAREVEFQMVINGVTVNSLILATKKGDLVVHTSVTSKNGKIGRDLKAIPYSIEFQPGKDEPVKLPPGVQEFLDKYRSDFVSRDVAKVMNYYSDRCLNSGMKKGEMERFWKQYIGPITSVEVGITDFETAGDKAYLAGFVSFNGAKWEL